jgi:hypothetical protein
MAFTWGGKGSKPDPDRRGKGKGTQDPADDPGTSTHQSYLYDPDGVYKAGQPYAYVNCYCKADTDHAR